MGKYQKVPTTHRHKNKINIARHCPARLRISPGSNDSKNNVWMPAFNSGIFCNRHSVRIHQSSSIIIGGFDPCPLPGGSTIKKKANAAHRRKLAETHSSQWDSPAGRPDQQQSHRVPSSGVGTRARTMEHFRSTYIEGLRKDDGDGGSHFVFLLRKSYLCAGKLN